MQSDRAVQADFVAMTNKRSNLDYRFCVIAEAKTIVTPQPMGNVHELTHLLE
jgi:hypothetical protein